jgi:glycosyl transferase family 2
MIALATVAFNQPWLVEEQIRLLAKHLRDPYRLTVFDNSTDPQAAKKIHAVCQEVEYERLPGGDHHVALNAAAAALRGSAPYIGFLDHDVFPTKPTRIISLIKKTGFYGVGQQHPASGRLYLWPGFCFFSTTWLGDRPLDFSGIRDGDPRNDGDTGSNLWPLFTDEDWRMFYRAQHYYRPIREPDSFGLQSWGVEYIGDWLHLSNGSNWMTIPRPQERQQIISQMLAEL